MKVNNPLIPKYPIPIHNRKEYDEWAIKSNNLGFKWVGGGSLIDNYITSAFHYLYIYSDKTVYWDSDFNKNYNYYEY